MEKNLKQFDEERSDNYDPHIVPAETAARMEREGENFKEFPESQSGINTTGGYTVDKEGLLNNYAMEPEMYVNEPGDLREKEEALEKERAQELRDINQPGGEDRKGQGIV